MMVDSRAERWAASRAGRLAGPKVDWWVGRLVVSWVALSVVPRAACLVGHWAVLRAEQSAERWVVAMVVLKAARTAA